MYNGIGLTTPRGSGTNGYVQRNLSYVRSQQTAADRAAAWGTAPPKHREPDQAILEHERKRQAEVKCLELQLELEDNGIDEEIIEKQVSDLREKLQASMTASINAKALKPSDTHGIALAKKVELDKMARALGTRAGYTEGDAFDREKQDELKAKRAVEREERDRKREDDKQKWQAQKEKWESEKKERDRLRRREEDRRRKEREEDDSRRRETKRDMPPPPPPGRRDYRDRDRRSMSPQRPSRLNDREGYGRPRGRPTSRSSSRSSRSRSPPRMTARRASRSPSPRGPRRIDSRSPPLRRRFDSRSPPPGGRRFDSRSPPPRGPQSPGPPPRPRYRRSGSPAPPSRRFSRSHSPRSPRGGSKNRAAKERSLSRSPSRSRSVSRSRSRTPPRKISRSLSPDRRGRMGGSPARPSLAKSRRKRSNSSDSAMSVSTNGAD